MSKMNKIVQHILHPSYVLLKLDNVGIVRLKDKKYLSILYKKVLDEKIDFDNPKTFNEKLQWLKLYDRKEIYTTMVDKYEAKNYVANIIGQEYIIPTIGVYDNFTDSDIDKLPNEFVIKCTHDSGGVVICKHVKPKIIIEKYMKTKNEDELIDYKFFCFNGEPKFVLTCSERFSSNNMCETFFDTNWNIMELKEGGHRVDEKLKKPINFSLMLDFAKKISTKIPFVRVDFYEIENKVYFGEITFFPNGGFEEFEPKECNYKFGQWIDLSGVSDYEK